MALAPSFASRSAPDFDMPPHRLSGVVYGALLNDGRELAALGDAVNQAPHKAPPRAPVLEVKPRNTLGFGPGPMVLPAGAQALEVGASLAIVMGRVACRVTAADAMAHVAGYLVAADASLPLPGHYRPSARLKARDGYCRLGTQVVPAAEVVNPDALTVTVSVGGQVMSRGSTASRTRGVAELIADVSAFMTLQAGDLLLLGRGVDSVRVQAGQQVTLAIGGIGQLDLTVEAEAPVLTGVAA